MGASAADVRLWTEGTSHRIIASAFVVPASLHAKLYLDDPESRSHLVILATFTLAAMLRVYCGEWMPGERGVMAWNRVTEILPLVPPVVSYATSSSLHMHSPEELMAMSFASMVVMLAVTLAAPMGPKALASIVAGHLLMFLGNVYPPTGITEVRKNAFMCMTTSFGAAVGLVLRHLMIDAVRAADLRSHVPKAPDETPIEHAPASATDGSFASSGSSEREEPRLSWRSSLAAATWDERRVMERVFDEKKAPMALTPRVLAAQCPLADVEMHSFVGAGSQGEVYLGALKGGRAVACKKVHRMHMRSEERILQELRLLDLHLGLEHPNIVRLVAVAWDVESALLLTIMDAAQRGSLADLLDPIDVVDEKADDIARDPPLLSRAQKLEIALGVARGLDYLHSQRRPILHRDLKPGNVLLDERLRPLLCDFGMSRHEASSGAINAMTAVGTPHFAAPEVINHKAYNVSADMWSFGALLACFHHRSLPYDADTARAQRTLLYNVGAGKLRPEVPDGHVFASLLPKCVRYAPEQRASASDAVASLTASLEQERTFKRRMIRSLPVD